MKTAADGSTIVTLYVATTNPGKLRDFSIAGLVDGIKILAFPKLGSIVAPPEDAPTFQGNAIGKAIYYSQHLPNELVVADDSGLEVDALNGAPGVFSARYATVQNFKRDGVTQDEINNACLLANLQQVPAGSRSARYQCSLAAAKNGECMFTSMGMVEGNILTVPRGQGGFGYDPLFFLSALGMTMAEIDLQTKGSISHRGIAIRSLLTAIRKSSP